MKKYLSLVLCVFVLTATANTAQAFDKKDLAKLKKTNQCIKCNLSGADLYKANLSKSNLTQADLRRANLTEANLSGVKMLRSRLEKADLKKSNLTGADLSGANLYKANLIGAKLDGATWTDGRKCGKGSIGRCN